MNIHMYIYIYIHKYINITPPAWKDEAANALATPSVGGRGGSPSPSVEGCTARDTTRPMAPMPSQWLQRVPSPQTGERARTST